MACVAIYDYVFESRQGLIYYNLVKEGEIYKKRGSTPPARARAIFSTTLLLRRRRQMVDNATRFTLQSVGKKRSRKCHICSMWEENLMDV